MNQAPLVYQFWEHNPSTISGEASKIQSHYWMIIQISIDHVTWKKSSGEYKKDVRMKIAFSAKISFLLFPIVLFCLWNILNYFLWLFWRMTFFFPRIFFGLFSDLFVNLGFQFEIIDIHDHFVSSHYVNMLKLLRKVKKIIIFSDKSIIISQTK